MHVVNVRKICVVTGTRAEYGLLRWLLEEINVSSNTELQLVVTGSHLEPEFGETFRDIELDGFTISRKVPLELTNDSPLGVAHSLALAVIGMAETFSELSPDLLVVLGDRYEILAAAQAAMLLNVPIAHIHGGERTEGAIDEAIRHAVTKLSHLHFASCEEYEKRIIQLGENPLRVWNTGSIALDNFEKLNLITRSELLDTLNMEERRYLVLCTLHPETLQEISPDQFISPLLSVLSELEEANIIFTLGNADAGGKQINDAIKQFVTQHPNNTRVVISLGQVRYISALKSADLVVGNSSSGIVEAPSAGTVVINIGDRQRGRVRSNNIIDVSNTESEIRVALEKGLSVEVQNQAARVISPFGLPGASKKIFDVIANHDLDGILNKVFFDLNNENPNQGEE
jgi:UDP-hydrolysing UDP-N-acetyl-D-glucosamine 2-epimerase